MIYDFELKDGGCICKHCGAKVETGILNLADHWGKCWGKAEFEFMKSEPALYLDMKRLEQIFKDHEKENI